MRHPTVVRYDRAVIQSCRDCGKAIGFALIKTEAAPVSVSSVYMLCADCGITFIGQGEVKLLTLPESGK